MCFFYPFSLRLITPVCWYHFAKQPVIYSPGIRRPSTDHASRRYKFFGFTGCADCCVWWAGSGMYSPNSKTFRRLDCVTQLETLLRLGLAAVQNSASRASVEEVYANDLREESYRTLLRIGTSIAFYPSLLWRISYSQSFVVLYFLLFLSVS